MNTVYKTLPAYLAVEPHASSFSSSNFPTNISSSSSSVHSNNVNRDVTCCSTHSKNKSSKAKYTSKQTIPSPLKIAHTVSNSEHIIAA